MSSVKFNLGLMNVDKDPLNDLPLGSHNLCRRHCLCSEVLALDYQALRLALIRQHQTRHREWNLYEDDDEDSL